MSSGGDGAPPQVSKSASGLNSSISYARPIVTSQRRCERWLYVRSDPASASLHTKVAVRSNLPPDVPYLRNQLWINWGRTARCAPEFTFYPRSVDDLQQIVHFARATGRKLRVAASGHSWSALVPTNEILVSIRHLNQVVMDLSDGTNPQVVIGSGATARDVNDVLERYGYALPLNVVLESVRYGGLIATGSHGSGWNNSTLSDLVSAIEIVTASGELRRFQMGVDSDDIMNAARLNLGLFGITYRVALKVQKSWHVRAVDQRVPIERTLDHLSEWVPSHENFDLFWWPFCDQFWIKTWDRTEAEITAKPRQSSVSRLRDAIGARVLGAGIALDCRFPRLTPAMSQALFKATPSRRDQTVDIVEAVHYRRSIEATKMGCVEVAFKIDPTFDNVKWAIEIVRDMTRTRAAHLEYPLNVTMNVRFIRNSNCWLSPAYGAGHTCYIEILSGIHTRGWKQFSGEVAQQWLQLLQARPHWAKEFRHIPGIVPYLRREMGANIARFNEIKERLQVDPDQMFVNDDVEEIFL